jgi:hypothetical protein
MSKVIHLSDSAHNAAKAFCKQHGLKMSDWVADLIADAIVTGRVDPRSPPRPVPAPVAPAPPPAVQNNAPPKKKLERYVEPGKPGEDAPPWAAPPFWTKAQNK